MKTPTQMTNKKYLTFRKGTTILAHDNLISFLHEKDTRILHRMFNDHEWQLIRGLNKIPYESYSEEDKRILDHLESVGILSKLEDTQNSHEFLERDNLQLLHMLVMITNRCNMFWLINLPPKLAISKNSFHCLNGNSLLSMCIFDSV